jgi:hypothetical protein
MSELLQSEPIMTVKRLRQLAGKDVAHLSDEQLEEAITHLDFMAQLFVKRKKNEIGKSPMKKD